MKESQRLGSMRENVVCADLQSRNFEVFREDGLCSFDIVAHKNGELIRIEVKGISRLPKGGGPVGCASKKCKVDCRKFDVMAGVRELPIGGFEIRYAHSIAHTHSAASYELTGPDLYPKKTTKKNLDRAKNFKGVKR